MGRPKRNFVDNGIFHITSRGHNRYKLFHSPEDYNVYRHILKRHKKRFHFYIFNYCLMSNHPHLLLRIEQGEELPRLMQGINQSYAKYYKKVYGLVGNLFQGRYNSEYIDKDSYLLECARYIERNPLRANIVKELSEYPYSSYNFYAYGKKDDIITINLLYETLAKSSNKRRRLYRDYILQPRPYEHILDKKLKV